MQLKIISSKKSRLLSELETNCVKQLPHTSHISSTHSLATSRITVTGRRLIGSRMHRGGSALREAHSVTTQRGWGHVMGHPVSSLIALDLLGGEQASCLEFLNRAVMSRRQSLLKLNVTEQEERQGEGSTGTDTNQQAVADPRHKAAKPMMRQAAKDWREPLGYFLKRSLHFFFKRG